MEKTHNPFPEGMEIIIESGCVTRRSLTALEDRSLNPDASNNNVPYLSLDPIGQHWLAQCVTLA